MGFFDAPPGVTTTIEPFELVDIKEEINYFVKLLENPNLDEFVKIEINHHLADMLRYYRKPIIQLKKGE